MEPLNAREVLRATEAEFGEDGSTWITIIKEGESANGRNYQKNALKQAVLNRVYEGTRMFLDHSDGPPLKRSIRELVSGIDETKYDESNPDGKGRVRGHVKWFNNDFREQAEKAKDFIGVSHDARLAGNRSRKNGRRYEDIEQIVKANSVDWVIYPSAGGGFDQFYAQEGIEPMEAIDWDSVTPEMLEENAPKVYGALKEKFSAKESKEDPTPPPPDDGDEKKGEVTKTAALDEKAIEGIVTRVFESLEGNKSKKADTRNKVAAIVKRSPLPERTKNRIVAQFDGAESFEEDSVKEAIKEAQEELKEAGAGPKITGEGPTRSAGSSHSLGRAHEAVASAFSFDPVKKKGDPDADKGEKKEEK